MARQGLINNNNKRLRLTNRYAEKRAVLKKVIYDKNTTVEARRDAQMALQKLPRNSSQVRYRNRCFLTGRSRGYYRLFKVSRIMLRELASQCQVPGVQKSSW